MYLGFQMYANQTALPRSSQQFENRNIIKIWLTIQLKFLHILELFLVASIYRKEFGRRHHNSYIWKIYQNRSTLEWHRSATQPEFLGSELTFLVHDRHKSNMPRQHFVGHFGDRKRHQHGRSLFRMFHGYFLSRCNDPPESQSAVVPFLSDSCPAIFHDSITVAVPAILVTSSSAIHTRYTTNSFTPITSDYFWGSWKFYSFSNWVWWKRRWRFRWYKPNTWFFSIDIEIWFLQIFNCFMSGVRLAWFNECKKFHLKYESGERSRVNLDGPWGQNGKSKRLKIIDYESNWTIRLKVDGLRKWTVSL